MNYFKNENNEIFAYDDEQVKQGYGTDLIAITESEKTELLQPSLEEIKASKINEINNACKAEIINGFPSSALGDEHIYQSEITDQLNLVGLVTAGTDDYLKCGVDSNGTITWGYELHTIAQLKQVLTDGKTIKETLLQKAHSLKNQVADAVTTTEVEAIVW